MMGGNEVDGTNDDIVRSSLYNFIKDHVGDTIKISDIDEIVLSYVVSILQDLVLSGPDEDDTFDVDDFCEMLTAYLPQSGDIPQAHVTEWIFGLAHDQRERENRTTEVNFDLKSVIEETTRVRHGSTSTSASRTSSDCSSFEGGRKNKKLSESSEAEDTEEFQAKVYQLMEMFPFSCEAEVGHCLTMMGGEVERASHLILHRHETGQSIRPTVRKVRLCLDYLN